MLWGHWNHEEAFWQRTCTDENLFDISSFVLVNSKLMDAVDDTWYCKPTVITTEITQLLPRLDLMWKKRNVAVFMGREIFQAFVFVIILFCNRHVTFWISNLNSTHLTTSHYSCPVDVVSIHRWRCDQMQDYYFFVVVLIMFIVKDCRLTASPNIFDTRVYPKWSQHVSFPCLIVVSK